MRYLPLLVLLYVVLDFANPLMPGAVRFESGSVESVQADRAGREVGAVVPAPATLRTEDRLPPDPAPLAAMLAPAMHDPARRDVRRVPAPRSDPPPSSTEDH